MIRNKYGCEMKSDTGVQKLIYYIKENKIKKKDFAEELGVSACLFSSCLTGNRNFSKKVAKRIEEITNGFIDCRDLLYP